MSATSHRRIVIGDVHGHYEGLMRLLEAIAPSSDDQVYFLGDLIDRGPKSSQVVKFVMDSPYKCLLGNHEQMLLNILTNRQISLPTVQSWLYSGGQATVASYAEATIPHDHLEWFSTLPTYLDLGDVWLVHAGIDPTMAIAEQTSQQFCWIREEFHGIKQPYFPDKLIIVGHTITFTLPGVTPGKIAQGKGWIGIDTGAYHPRSGWLTALDITNNLVYQVNIFRHCIRTLPLEKAVTTINPEDIHESRHKKCLVG
ncbi:metallophosphoesterase family protein [Calothrix sp. 336/3]|uniref:metallophosphoesterase family protein n=1 Tax=Calothrix sp. 336/3 TaxID=1337936 RepID=UPI0004E3E965|nr:metallophosphoesterase family protein [Calothrix sp. 336/3]AKG22391.1 serine/threonine protein phosphatase [Calothrix sp. 336/3]